MYALQFCLHFHCATSDSVVSAAPFSHHLPAVGVNSTVYAQSQKALMREPGAQTLSHILYLIVL